MGNQVDLNASTEVLELTAEPARVTVALHNRLPVYLWKSLQRLHISFPKMSQTQNQNELLMTRQLHLNVLQLPSHKDLTGFLFFFGRLIEALSINQPKPC